MIDLSYCFIPCVRIVFIHSFIHFLVCLFVLFIPNSYTILFWEFYFIPFSVHVQTNIIYIAHTSYLCMLLWWCWFNYCVCILYDTSYVHRVSPCMDWWECAINWLEIIIKWAECFSSLSHHQALIKNIEKTVNTVVGAISPPLHMIMHYKCHKKNSFERALHKVQVMLLKTVYGREMWYRTCSTDHIKLFSFYLNIFCLCEHQWNAKKNSLFLHVAWILLQ
jgi:hypothetical protein